MSRRIVLIEGNEQKRYLATFALRACGWDGLHASDGPGGIALARECALAAGCEGRIEWPIDPDAFVATVERHLSADAGSRP